MKNFTQRALFVVLTVFVLVGMFYGLTTPVKASAGPKKISTISYGGDPEPMCDPDKPQACLPQPGNN